MFSKASAAAAENVPGEERRRSRIQVLPLEVGWCWWWGRLQSWQENKKNKSGASQGMGFSGAAGLGRLPWLWNWFFWSFIGLYWTVLPRGTPRMPKSSFISFIGNGTVSPLESVPPLRATEPDSPPDPNWDFNGINFVQIMSLDWSLWQIKAPVLAPHRNCWNPAHFGERSADFHQREKGSFPVLVLIHQRSPANSCLLFLFFFFFFFFL